MSVTTVDELQVLITANTKNLQEQINNANKKVRNLQNSATKSTSGVMSAFKTLKTGIVALGIGKVIKDSITSGMDAIETDTLFSTVLGNNAEAVRNWSNTVADTLGLSSVAMQKNIGVIYNMTTSMGVAGENALKMSKGVSVLAEDMASFYNIDSTEAFNKIRAGLTGETEPLKQLGILVDENTIKQVAYSQGIAEVGAELNNEQKAMARYVAIMQQTGNAQGDLARTINSPANQLRQLKQQVTQLGIAFSNILMPVVQAVLPWLNALAKVATQAFNSLSSFFGLTGNKSTSVETQKISENVGGLSGDYDNATKSAKKLKSTLAGFDEMNVLSDNSANADSGESVSAGTAVVGLDFDLSEYDAHLDWVESDTNQLAERIKAKFTETFGSIDLTNFLTALSGLKESLLPLAENVGSGLGWFLNNVLVPIAEWTIEDVIPEFLKIFGGAIDIVNQAITDVQPIFQWFWDNVLSPIAAWTGGVIVSVLSGVGDALKWIADNEIAMIILESIAGAIGLVAAAILIYNGVMAACNIVTGIFSGIMAVLTSPITLVVAAIAAVIAIIALCIKYWDDIKAAAVKCWDGIKAVWNAVANWIKTYVVDPIKNFFVALWEGIKGVWNAVTGWFKNLFVGAWDGIKSAWSAVKTWFANLWNGIKNVFSSVGSWFGETFTKAWNGVKNAWSACKGFFSGIWDGLKEGGKKAWEGIKSVFSSVGLFFKTVFKSAWKGIVSVFSTAGEIFTDIKDGIVSVFKTVVNGLITGINSVVKLPFEGLNKILNKIQNLEIVGVKPFSFLSWRAPVPQIPKLARGGIVDRPTYAMIGEAGAEAVMPLERNTGWIDKLADQIGEKIGGGDIKVTVKLGEDTIFDKFIEYGRAKAFETNGGVVFA